ncbi:MAG: glutaredoxin 3 [Alphaproteobacteria bacterium]
MAKIEIYTTLLCPFCHAAKRLLQSKGAQYLEKNVTMNPLARAKMTRRANGQHTVPQIFIEDRHIGGCDDLYALDSRGSLDPLLTA